MGYYLEGWSLWFGCNTCRNLWKNRFGRAGWSQRVMALCAEWSLDLTCWATRILCSILSKEIILVIILASQWDVGCTGGRWGNGVESRKVMKTLCWTVPTGPSRSALCPSPTCLVPLEADFYSLFQQTTFTLYFTVNLANRRPSRRRAGGDY